MSDSEKQFLGEIDTADTDSLEDSHTDDGDEDTDLEEEDSKGRSAIGLEQREKQIQSWLKRAQADESVLDNLPKAQQWIKKEVISRLKPVNKASPDDIDALLDKKLAERESEKRFTSLKEDYDNMSLTQEERKAVKAEYAELREGGLAKDKALAKALKLAGIKVEESSRTGGVKVPKGSNAKGTSTHSESDDITADDLKTIPDDDFMRLIGKKK